jgi:cobalt-zinc-cadmium efflux system protein
MTHGHLHDHSNHSHGPDSFNRAFAIGAALNLGLVVAQIGFGLVANSLALIADADHYFADVIGLVLAWGASWLGSWQPTRRHTYGFRRASILAVLANAGLLFVGVGAIIIESLRRLATPEPIQELTVIWVAVLGILVNAATAMLFMRGRHHDLNIRGAFLHMAADAGISLGVVVAATVIMWTRWLWIDPAVSLAIAAAILVSTWGLARRSVDLALDAVPEDIDRHAIEAYLTRLPGVSEMHDLHIWAMSTTETALTVHLVRPNAPVDDHFIAHVAEELAHRFRIQHTTVQIEAGDPAHPCRLASAETV